MAVRVVMREGEPLRAALARLREQLRREAIDDRSRRRWWRVEYHQKPGYVRRQQKFFARVEAQRREQFFRRFGCHLRLPTDGPG